MVSRLTFQKFENLDRVKRTDLAFDQHDGRERHGGSASLPNIGASGSKQLDWRMAGRAENVEQLLKLCRATWLDAYPLSRKVDNTGFKGVAAEAGRIS